MTQDNRPSVTITNDNGVYRYRVQCGERVFDGNAETMAIHMAFAFDEIERLHRRCEDLMTRWLVDTKQEPTQ